MAGAGRRVFVYIPEMQEPELMYKLFDAVVQDTYHLIKFFDQTGAPKKMTPEEFDIMWEESGKKQEKMMQRVQAAGGCDPADSPMIQRWLDGSDIVDNDAE